MTESCQVSSDVKPAGLAHYAAGSRLRRFPIFWRPFPKYISPEHHSTFRIRGLEVEESPDDFGHSQPRWLHSAPDLSLSSAFERSRRDVLNQTGRWNYEVDGWSICRGWVVHISSCRPDLMIADAQHYLIASSVVYGSTAQICTACSRDPAIFM